MKRGVTGTYEVAIVGGERVEAFVPAPLPPVPGLDFTGRLQPLLYLSLHFKQHRPVYYDLLGGVRGDGDWEGWLEFFLEGVGVTAEGAVSAAQRLSALFKTDRERVVPTGRRAGSALRVFDALRARPVSSVQQPTQLSGLTFPTASSAVDVLVSLGIAREMTGRRRNRIFIYDGYLDILNEGTEE